MFDSGPGKLQYSTGTKVKIKTSKHIEHKTHCKEA